MTTSTLVATPDPQQPQRCTCRFTIAHTRRDHQWVFRRDPACPEHGRRGPDDDGHAWDLTQDSNA